MISNFKLFPYFNISKNFVQNVQKQKKKNLRPELQKLSHNDAVAHSILQTLLHKLTLRTNQQKACT